MTKKALLLGFDGLDLRVLQRMLTDGQLPTFAQFNLQKAYTGGVKGTRTEQLSFSSPGWMTVLTGTWINTHHIYENQTVKTVKGVPSIFKLIKDGSPEKKVYSAVAWRQIHIRLIKEDREILDQEFLEDKQDDMVKDKIVNSLEEVDAPDFMFVQFDDIDHTAHQFGFGSNYDNEVLKGEQRLKEIMEKLEERKNKYINEDWLVLLVADHGREPNGEDHAIINPMPLTEKTIFIASNKQMNSEFTDVIEDIQNKSYNGIYGYPAQSSITPTILQFLEIPKQKYWNFDNIPLMGPLGIRKLMEVGNKLVWAKIQESEREIIQKMDNQIVVEADGELIESLQSNQTEWPLSKKGIAAWKKNTYFKFTHNGVTVTYNKSVFYHGQPFDWKIILYISCGVAFLIFISAFLFIKIRKTKKIKTQNIMMQNQNSYHVIVSMKQQNIKEEKCESQPDKQESNLKPSEMDIKKQNN